MDSTPDLERTLTEDAVANDFDRLVAAHDGRPLNGLTLSTVQVNIGLRCNLACRHCHVRSSPARREAMTWETMLEVLDAARRCEATTLDVTGGAPELHPNFREFIDAASRAGLHVVVRTNLTVLLQPEIESLPRFLADRGVQLIASLPCYLESGVASQRGAHVYDASIAVIRRLNALGYAAESGPVLDLVFNPRGPALPPDQADLEAVYRRELGARFGIRFNRLYAIANMPIGRFLEDLERNGEAGRYRAILRRAFNPRTLPSLMCRRQIHVGWDGMLHDCDFNYGVGLRVRGPTLHVRDIAPKALQNRLIATADHCLGCTAGSGSSCTGALE